MCLRAAVNITFADLWWTIAVLEVLSHYIEKQTVTAKDGSTMMILRILTFQTTSTTTNIT
jgi:hypothetical protein